MTTPRIEELLAFYLDDPADPFNAYALALEYLKSDKGKAKEWFELLFRTFPEYLPLYYQYALLLAELGYQHEAVATAGEGMQLAIRLGNVKAYRELQSLKQELEDD